MILINIFKIYKINMITWVYFMTFLHLKKCYIEDVYMKGESGWLDNNKRKRNSEIYYNIIIYIFLLIISVYLYMSV